MQRPLSFSSTRHKIAFFFSLLSSVFLVISTLMTIVLLRWEITRQANSTLDQALSSVRTDYQANQLTSKVSSVFQFDTTRAPSYSRTRQLPNVSDTKIVAPEDSVAVAENLNQAESVQTSDQQSLVLATLEKNRQVYSRVVAGNGDILFTSDLFTAYNIDPQRDGFFTFETSSSCFHILTSRPDAQGTIIQVGQYCAVSFSQQISIFLKMLVVTIGLVLATYWGGWIMAGQFLKPLEKAVKQTRQFAENCYHELLTPISVAISSVSAALNSKKYQAGLHSVDEDLREVYYSLQILSKNALQDQALTLSEEVNFSELVLKALQKCEAEAQKKQLNFDIGQVHKRIIKKAEPSSCRILLDNILNNAVKYAQPQTTLTVSLNATEFSVQNFVSNAENLAVNRFFERGYRGKNAEGSQGHGLGLAISQELAEAHGWSITATSQKNLIVVQLAFSFKSGYRM